MTAKQLTQLTAEDVQAMTADGKFDAVKAIIGEMEKADEDGRGKDRATLYSKLDLFDLPNDDSYLVGGIQDIRRQDWQRNHIRIKAYIRNHLLEHKGLPHITKIAEDLKLCRQTVYEHINEASSSPFFREQLKQMEYMTLDILELLYLYCSQGNVMAGKVYLDYIQKAHQTQIRQQNNYLQINNLTINEEQVRRLPTDDRMRVNRISAELKEIVTKYQAF